MMAGSGGYHGEYEHAPCQFCCRRRGGCCLRFRRLLPANAECKRYGFTVNDYGKDGPTKDAKELLDKLIASKMSEKGVKDFHTGKKSVSCELFLNFIVFDEHTCTAEATVCWGGTPLPNSEQTAAAETDTKAKATKTSSGEPAEKVNEEQKEGNRQEVRSHGCGKEGGCRQNSRSQVDDAT